MFITVTDLLVTRYNNETRWHAKHALVYLIAFSDMSADVKRITSLVQIQFPSRTPLGSSVVRNVE